jgi:predicted P-loop ATPase
MIDLNDVYQPLPQFDFREIRDRLSASADHWLPNLFPNARISSDRRVLRCADLSGRAPRKEGSCVIHLRGEHAGTGYDFGTGEGAGPIDLIRWATGLSDRALFDEAARLAHMDQPKASASKPAAPKDYSKEIAQILGGCKPLARSHGETYLRGRGLSDPQSPDLQFHPDLNSSRRGYCALVAIVRKGDGERTGGIHRTFLTDDGSSKAEPGKKMLGPVAGGAVQLQAMGKDRHLGIAEGIETALAAMAIFSVPAWAALSADGLRRWDYPQAVESVTIFADAGEPGRLAAEHLRTRLEAQRRNVRVVLPIHGDDFNDDLIKGAQAADYGPPLAIAAPVEFASIAAIEAAAGKITKDTGLVDIAKLLGALIMLGADPIQEEQILATLKRNCGMPIKALRDQVRELKKRFGKTGNLDRDPLRPPWAKQLRNDLFGNPERNEANVITALSNDQQFAGAIVFDEFRQEIMVVKPLPWNEAAGFVVRPWADVDDIRAAEWLQRRDVNIAPNIVSRSVEAVAREITIHPVRDYLRSLKWDLEPRLETWAIDYLGAEDTPLNRAFGALWMISAVARIMKPGCKADHMLILEGEQGIKKSTALKVLAGAEYFTDELAEVGSKDAAQQLRGVWVVEIAELDAIGRAEVSRIKAFLTRTNDRYRPPYGRYVIDVPRQCVFAGSVNPDTYLRDETGNRRFWPLPCGEINLVELERDRDQLWAEAVRQFMRGAIWWIEDPKLIAAAKEQQDARFQGDAWDDRIEHWLRYDTTLNNAKRLEPLDDVSIGEVLEGAIALPAGKWTRGDQMRIAAYLKRDGWERYNSGNRSGRVWRYRKT